MPDAKWLINFLNKSLMMKIIIHCSCTTNDNILNWWIYNCPKKKKKINQNFVETNSPKLTKSGFQLGGNKIIILSDQIIDANFL